MMTTAGKATMNSRMIVLTNVPLVCATHSRPDGQLGDAALKPMLRPRGGPPSRPVVEITTKRAWLNEPTRPPQLLLWKDPFAFDGQ